MTQTGERTRGGAGRLEKLLVLIPAFNEEGAIGALVDEVRAAAPAMDVLVVSDGSVDGTVGIARARGAMVLDLPINLGVGGAVQAGFQYAVSRGYDAVVRIDGDGQHPPAEVARLVDAARGGAADLIVGTRFGLDHDFVSSSFRLAGIKALALFLTVICRHRVTDPTSGFWLVRRPLLDYFSRSYPSEYPEPEALALLRRQGYSFVEVPVRFRARQAGRSTIRRWDTVYFALKVGLALVVDRIRPVNRRFSRDCLAGRVS